MAILRLASSRVGRLAVRAIASPRILYEFITNAFKGSTNQHSLVESTPICDEKKLVDRYLVKVLKSEIKSKQLYLEKSMPADFPFTILDDFDDPHKRNITNDRNMTWRREFDGEIIDVVVKMPCFLPRYYEEESVFSVSDINDDDSNDDSDSDSDEDKEKSAARPSPSLDLTVNIFNTENGKSLSFDVSASVDAIKIKSMSVKLPTEDRWSQPKMYMVDNYGNLQRGLREYLKIRGIKKTSAAFLYKYMVRKSKKQTMLVLKNLKKYIKE